RGRSHRGAIHFCAHRNRFRLQPAGELGFHDHPGPQRRHAGLRRDRKSGSGPRDKRRPDQHGKLGDGPSLSTRNIKCAHTGGFAGELPRGPRQRRQRRRVADQLHGAPLPRQLTCGARTLACRVETHLDASCSVTVTLDDKRNRTTDAAGTVAGFGREKIAPIGSSARSPCLTHGSVASETRWPSDVKTEVRASSRNEAFPSRAPFCDSMMLPVARAPRSAITRLSTTRGSASTAWNMSPAVVDNLVIAERGARATGS